MPILSGTIHSEESWHKPESEGGLGRVRLLAEVAGSGGGGFRRGAGGSVSDIRYDPDGGRMRLEGRVVVE